MTTETKAARRAHALLVRNADRYHYRQISYEQHRSRNRIIWDAIVARGNDFNDAVLTLLREA